MRIRLTDGAREVEVRADRRRTTLREVEDVACRLLAQLREPAPSSAKQVETEAEAFGFSLDSNTERAGPYDDGRGYEDDE